MDRRRPTVNDDSPLEILPWGKSSADASQVDANRRKFWHGCLFLPALATLILVYIAGYVAAKFG